MASASWQQAKHSTMQNSMSTKKTDWKLWAQVVLTILTAIASALGITSCAMKMC